MKKIDLGQTITILANVGVIAGILLLAFELSQNNKLLRAQADETYLQNRLDNRQRIIEDPEFAQLWVKLSKNEPLDEIEEVRLAAMVEETILEWQWEFRSIVDGTLNKDLELAAEGYSQNFRRQGSRLAQAFPDQWPSVRRTLEPDFVRWMEENVVNER